MLSHDNLTWDANAFVQFIKDEGVIADLGPDQVYLSYLPLSHIAALLLDFMLAAVSGGSIYFATPDALSGGLLPLLQQTRPTFFFGVPRVWEKIMDAMKAKGAAGSETQKKIAAAAKAVGLARNMGLAESGGQTTGLSCADEVKYLLCKAVVFAKIKATLGLREAEDVFTPHNQRSREHVFPCIPLYSPVPLYSSSLYSRGALKTLHNTGVSRPQVGAFMSQARPRPMHRLRLGRRAPLQGGDALLLVDRHANHRGLRHERDHRLHDVVGLPVKDQARRQEIVEAL